VEVSRPPTFDFAQLDGARIEGMNLSEASRGLREGSARRPKL